ncbi:MAG: DUF3796 domain-containing protein [Candidatus Thorarchaeota archaeon]|nr:DUF3796 domain-containing protein [Candidatus Thorarchaeota archaeon]
MQINLVNYLGFLGFLGLLGFVTGNVGFLGFFGFFGFLSILGGRGSDERIENSINRACRNAYIVITITMVSSLVYVVSFDAIQAFPLVFALLFIVSIMAFVFSFIVYNRRGD